MTDPTRTLTLDNLANGMEMQPAHHKALPPLTYLKECLNYDPESGKFVWNRRPLNHFPTEMHWRTFNTRFAGREAGYQFRSRSKKYQVIGINREKFLAHRLAWAFYHGACSELDLLDHINNDGTDNRIANLRLATLSQNGQNQKQRLADKMKGVTLCHGRGDKKWMAQIKIYGKRKDLGRFRTQAEAHEAYMNAAKVLFGEFARSA